MLVEKASKLFPNDFNEKSV